MDELDLGATIRGFSVNQIVFGRYTLKKILGRGGMGIVWLARDDELELEIALKFLPEVVSADKEAVRDLKRETRRSLELTHPHIVRIYDFVQGPHASAIAMEYIAGDTLASLKVDTAKGFFEVRDIEAWVDHGLAALEYAHDKAQIVHRDLKPVNLMVNGAGDLKITDFGIAASVSDSVSRVSARAGSSGTPVYMSPQQMMGERPAVTDDIYSLGATLYDLLTGKPPFYAGNVIRQVEVKVAPSISERRKELGLQGEEIPPAWDQAVAACLAKDPKERPQSVSELAALLRQGFAGRARLDLAAGAVPKREPTNTTFNAPTTSAPSLPIEPAETPVAPQVAPNGKKKGAIIAVIALVVVLLAGAGYYVGFHMPAQKHRDELARKEAQTRALAEAEASARGSLRVRTEPAGAEITVGALPPGPSPLAKSDLPPGPVKVTARLTSYEDGSQSVVVKKNEETDVLIHLQHSVGTLEISSKPAGIAYFIFGPGTNRDGHTPATEERLTTGQYKVVFRRRGWPEQSQTVEVRRQEKAVASAEFAPGLVRITSEPDGATVYSDEGKRIGETPLIVPEVPTGTTQYTLTREGYENKQVEGEVTSRKMLNLDVRLTKKERSPSTTSAAVVPAPTPREAAEGVPQVSATPQPASEANGARKTPELGKRWTIPEINVEMIPIQPGSFVMSFVDLLPVPNQKPREVKLTKAYWLGKTELTLGQWKLFADETQFKSMSEDGSGLDAFLNNQWTKLPGTSWREPKFPTAAQTDESPVVGLSWDEVHQFILWLNKRERAAGRLPAGYEYSLPTEAQWEFGAHGAAGDQGAPTLAEGWFMESANYATHPVAVLKPNRRGLYDMYGNAWEWCEDGYDAKLPGGKVTDPGVGPPAVGALRPVRGGSWFDVVSCYKLRLGLVPYLRAANLGFRLALVSHR